MKAHRRALVGGLLLLSGTAVLGWVAWAMVRPLPAPYAYQLVEQGSARDFPDLGLTDWPDVPLRTYEVRSTEAERSYAVLHTSVDSEGAPVLLDWKSRVAEPVVTQTAPLDDLVALAQAIDEHTPPDAILLSWWDTSRQLALLTGRETLFNENLAEPLLLPGVWEPRRDAIASLERSFWQAEPESSTSRFGEFIEALLQDPQAGSAELARLAGRGPAYLVLHQADAYKLGTLQPGKLGIGYRDFASNGQIHGLIQRAKQWLRTEGYQSYAVDASDPSFTRIYYLTDPSAETTLAVKALSFTTSNPLDLEVLKPVFQHSGYWVFEIPVPDAIAQESSSMYGDVEFRE